MFLRVNPDWRKAQPATKAIFKTEFQDTFTTNSPKTFCFFSYSLVGFDSKADLMFWRIGNRSI
jgi:chlorite dismutase